MSEKQVKTTELCTLTLLAVALMKGCVASSAKKQRRGTEEGQSSFRQLIQPHYGFTLNKASREENLELRPLVYDYILCLHLRPMGCVTLVQPLCMVIAVPMS